MKKKSEAVTTDPTIIERVARLLALAEGTSNPNEAAVAAAQAQRLMTKHRLSRTDVLDDGSIKVHGDAPLFEAKRVRAWLFALANAVSQTNACFNLVVRDAAGRKGLVVVGRTEDVEMVRQVFDYVRREIDRIARHYRRAGVFWERGSETRFRLGAVTAVSMAMSKARRETLHGAPADAIVKVERDSKAAERWAFENIPGIKEADQHRVDVDPYDVAFYRGFREGEKIAVPGKDPKRRLT